MSETAVVWSVKTGVGSSGSLSVKSSGQISFLNASSGQNLWPKNATAASGSGQLVLRNDGNLIFGSSWESFNFPTDTFLPNQTMNGTQITSANGKFSLSSGALIFNNTEVYWPSGTVGSFLMLNDLGRIDLENQSPILSLDLGDSLLRRLTLDNDGNLRMLSHRDDQWTMVLQSNPELCRIHGSYGRNSICMSDGGTSTNCILPARIPIRRRRTLPLRSQAPDPDKTVFLRLDYVNFTGGSNQTDIKSENFADCRDKCLSRPTCLGFMFKYDGSRYYVLQIDNLLFGYWSPGTEFSEEFNATRRNIAIIVTLFAAELFSVIVFFWVFLKKYIKYRNMAQTLALELLPTGGPKRFTFAETKAATNGFTDPIGKGGFGDVYKGELPDKRVVAVKCLKSVAGRSSGPRSRSSPGCTI